MKKYSLLALALILCAGAYSQETTDPEKEKEAIIAVINAETQAYCDRDWDAFAATYKHDDSNMDIRASKTTYGITAGWESPGSSMKQSFANNPEPFKNLEAKKNFRIKVYQDCAWALFDQDTYNDEGEMVGSALGVNFLEKIDGEWKIVFLERLAISSYYEGFKEIRLSDEELEKYAGRYEVQPGSPISVFNVDNRIYVQATPEYKFEIFPMGEDKFFAKEFYAQFKFNKEIDQVIGLTVSQNGETVFKKID